MRIESRKQEPQLGRPSSSWFQYPKLNAGRIAAHTAAPLSAAGYGSGSYSGYGCPASNYWVPYGTSSSAPYGIYASSYPIACERLKSGYAAPYGPIFY